MLSGLRGFRYQYLSSRRTGGRVCETASPSQPRRDIPSATSRRCMAAPRHQDPLKVLAENHSSGRQRTTLIQTARRSRIKICRGKNWILVLVTDHCSARSYTARVNSTSRERQLNVGFRFESRCRERCGERQGRAKRRPSGSGLSTNSRTCGACASYSNRRYCLSLNCPDGPD